MSKNDEPSVITCFYCGGPMGKKDRIEMARSCAVALHKSEMSQQVLEDVRRSAAREQAGSEEMALARLLSFLRP
jgi:hypothetical protein